MRYLIKEYTKQYLIEASLEDILNQLSDSITVKDMLDALSGKMSKKRLKKIGIALIKTGVLTGIEIIDAIGDVGTITDAAGAMKDAFLDQVQQAIGGLGIDGLIEKLRNEDNETKRSLFDLDPFYTKIVKEEVQQKFIKDYIIFLEKNKKLKLKDFIRKYGDINSNFELWLGNKFNGRTLDTVKEEQDLY